MAGETATEGEGMGNLNKLSMGLSRGDRIRLSSDFLFNGECGIIHTK